MTRNFRLLGAILAMSLLATPVLAQELTGTLKKIKETGAITVGHRDGFEAMLRAVDQHQLKPVVDRVFAFAELKEAMAYLQSGAQFGKVCLAH